MTGATADLNLDRRTLLTNTCAALAVAAAGTGPAFAASPIHAAIEAHKAAWAALGMQVDNTDILEAVLPRERRKVYGDREDDHQLSQTDDPRWTAHQEALSAANARVDDCAIALLLLEPTTIADLVVLVTYISDAETRGANSWPDVEEEGMRFATWDKCFHRQIKAALARMGAA